MPSVAGLVATCIRANTSGRRSRPTAAITAITAPASISTADDDVEHEVHSPRRPT